MTSRCLSCEHLSLFQDAIQGRGLLYIGACAHPSKTALGKTEFCAATENFAYNCRLFESAADAAVKRALEAEEA
jgi:hypothetical protein